MLAFVAAFAFNALGALVAGPSRARKAAALTLSTGPYAVALASPPEGVFLHVWVWVGSMFLSLRMLDVLAEARRPALFRLGLMLSALDLRTAQPESGVPLALAGRALAFATLAAATYAALPGAPRPVQWVGAAAFLYVGMEAADAIFRLPIRVSGAALRPLQATPIRSRSLAEFWGRRWNREVGRLLFRWCFRPLARRGHAGLGLAWAFTFSGLLHSVGTFFAIGARPALCVQAFFMLHGALVAGERAIGVDRWPGWAARGWVVASFVATGPLFLDAALTMIGLA